MSSDFIPLFSQNADGIVRVAVFARLSKPSTAVKAADILDSRKSGVDCRTTRSQGIRLFYVRDSRPGEES